MMETPRSPLISLLQSIYPAERLRITAVNVSLMVGYTGTHPFQNASQALEWLSPTNPGNHVASRSWQDMSFRRQLTIDDLARVAKVPDEVRESWWARNQHLPRPGRA